MRNALAALAAMGSLAGCLAVGDAAYNRAEIALCEEIVDPAARSQCELDAVARRGERNAERRADKFD